MKNLFLIIMLLGAFQMQAQMIKLQGNEILTGPVKWFLVSYTPPITGTRASCVIEARWQVSVHYGGVKVAAITQNKTAQFNGSIDVAAIEGQNFYVYDGMELNAGWVPLNQSLNGPAAVYQFQSGK